VGAAGVLKKNAPISYGDGRTVPAAGHTIGSAWADFDNDLHFDLLVGNFAHAAAYQDRPQILRNTGPKGGWALEDRSKDAGIRYQESYCGAVCADVDNDGRVDFFLPTTYERDHGVLYRNAGGCRFQEVRSGIDHVRSYQAAWADYDNDGNLDLLAAGKLWRNPGAGRSWIKVRPAGKKKNPSAIGARVICRAGALSQVRQVEAGTSSGAQNDLTLHFGLGSETGEAALEVLWPSGKRQTAKGTVRTTVTVEEE
jgi:hypothetical protein